jgi:DNA-binding winged helix-turn-helix (wHTH) protein
MYVFADVELDLDRYEIRRHGSAVPVEPQVFDVLAYLAAHGDRVVSKEELLDNIWGDRFVSESALTSRIKSARRAVGDDGHAQRVIATVHRRGYRMTAPVDFVGPSVCCDALTTSSTCAARSAGAALGVSA